MLRIVVSGRDTAEAEAKLDDSGRSHGRGAYICCSESCINGAFEKGLIDDGTRDECLAGADRKKLSMLMIAAKAGRICSGEYQVENAIKSGEAHFIIIAADASENTKHKFQNKCNFYEVPFVLCSTKENLGRMIGKDDRSCVAVTDIGFAKQLIDRFEINLA